MKLSLRTCISITTLILIMPLGHVSGSDIMTRGDFIELVVQELEVPVLSDSFIDKNKYIRIPNYLLPEVDALARRNALRVFGSSIATNRTITRGQAAQIVVELQGAKSIDKISFRDVRPGTAEAKAIQAVVAKQWLLPLAPNYFGVDRLLTIPEAHQFMSRVSGKSIAPTTVEPVPSSAPTAHPITVTVPTNGAQSSVPKQDVLNAVWQLIDDNYLYSDNINENEAGYDAIEAVVHSLNDEYTTFMRPQATDDLQIQLSGRVTGIGAQVENRNGFVTIVAPLPGSPAEQSGLLPNDQIIAVDNESLLDLQFNDAVNKVRGPRGSVVRLTIRRNGNELYFNVQREVVNVPDFAVEWQDKIAVVKIMQFGQITKTQLRTELQAIVAKNPQGIIFDLRNNPGGLLDTAGIVVGTVVPKGTIYAEIRSRSFTANNKTYEDPVIPATVPLIVLVNAGSASASEIVAGALQDSGRAQVVGQPTFGKGTVQEIVQFNDNSSLKMTVAEWFTPKGRKINKVGIEPDIIVELNDDRDAVLLKALELLR